METPQALVDGLGVTPLWAGHNRLNFVAEPASADVVRELTRARRALAELPGQGVIVTVPGGTDDIDYVCRVLGLEAGIPEDPATGSAQCAELGLGS